MKFLIASDIHGSAKYCALLKDEFLRSGADKLILLGDILYHGPRNPLPEDYAPSEVAEILGEVKDKIICVRGNCDADIDLCLLPFPVTDSALVYADGLNIYLAHGDGEPPHLCAGDVYITGHTHVPVKEEVGYYHLNPGSVSLPKEESAHGYILYANRRFSFKNIEGETYDCLDLTDGQVRHAPVIRRKVVRRKPTSR